MRSKTWQRPAFTLIQLLVALAIMGVLVALTAVGIQAARAAARRISCANNLRQIGIGLNSFAASKQVLPALVETGSPGGGAGPLYAIAPFLDESTKDPSSFYLVHRHLPPFPEAFGSLREILLCPSDYGRSGTNYRSNAGSDPYVYRQGGRLLGPFGFNTKLSLSRITDGLDNTAAYSERIRGDGTQRREYLGNTRICGVQSAGVENPPTLDDVLATCFPLASSSSVYGFSGHDWQVAGHAHAWYIHARGTNPTEQDLILGSPVGPVMPDGGVVDARSYHPGGAYLAFASGRVKFFTDSTDVQIWRSLGTASAGEVSGN